MRACRLRRMIVQLISKFFLFFLCFFYLPAYANTPSTSLIQLLNNVRSMQADFTQVVSDNRGKAVNKTRGHMALQRPGKFRWDTQQPNKQLIVTNGQKVWIYDPDLEQVSIRYLTKEAGETPALLLSNTNATLENDFRVQMLSDDSSLQWFLLTPRDKGSMFEAIRLGFANQQIRQMQLQDHLGHVTRIRFDRIVVNATLSPSLFTFRPPANVDVIDETKR